MSKGRNKKKKQTPMPQQVVVTPPAGMSSDEMQHVIAMAIVEAEKIKERKKQEQKEAERKEWREAIGYKEYDDKNKLIRCVKTFWNRIISFVRVCFVRKQYIKGDRVSFNLMKMLLCKSFDLVKICMNILTAMFILYIPAQYIIPMFKIYPWHQSVLMGMYGLLTFMLSRLFRMASFEIEKIEDRNYLFGLFASVASIVSIVIAIIAIVKGG